MDDDFFDYLVATGQVDDFLGYKSSDIYEALCLCAEDILHNNLNNINEIAYIEINKLDDSRYEIIGYVVIEANKENIKRQFITRFDFTGKGYRYEELILK